MMHRYFHVRYSAHQLQEDPKLINPFRQSYTSKIAKRDERSCATTAAHPGGQLIDTRRFYLAAWHTLL